MYIFHEEQATDDKHLNATSLPLWCVVQINALLSWVNGIILLPLVSLALYRYHEAVISPNWICLSFDCLFIYIL